MISSYAMQMIDDRKCTRLTLFSFLILMTGAHFVMCLWAHESRHHFMMTSSNRNIFRVTGHLCGEYTGRRRIPHTKASDAELWCFFICVWISSWVNNREAGDLRRYHAHYDVTVMCKKSYMITNDDVMAQCCICHNSWAVADCAKLRHE